MLIVLVSKSCDLAHFWVNHVDLASLPWLFRWGLATSRPTSFHRNSGSSIWTNSFPSDSWHSVHVRHGSSSSYRCWHKTTTCSLVSWRILCVYSTCHEYMEPVGLTARVRQNKPLDPSRRILHLLESAILSSGRGLQGWYHAERRLARVVLYMVRPTILLGATLAVSHTKATYTLLATPVYLEVAALTTRSRARNFYSRVRERGARWLPVSTND